MSVEVNEKNLKRIIVSLKKLCNEMDRIVTTLEAVMKKET